MKRATLAVTLLLAATCFSGCEEGGPFFTQIGQFVHTEGKRTDDFVPTLDRYKEAELEKPAMLASQTKSFSDREKRNKNDLLSTWNRYRTKEQEMMPSFKAMEDKAKAANEPRYFPDTSQYGAHP